MAKPTASTSRTATNGKSAPAPEPVDTDDTDTDNGEVTFAPGDFIEAQLPKEIKVVVAGKGRRLTLAETCPVYLPTLESPDLAISGWDADSGLPIYADRSVQCVYTLAIATIRSELGKAYTVPAATGPDGKPAQFPTLEAATEALAIVPPLSPLPEDWQGLIDFLGETNSGSHAKASKELRELVASVADLKAIKADTSLWPSCPLEAGKHGMLVRQLVFTGSMANKAMLARDIASMFNAQAPARRIANTQAVCDLYLGLADAQAANYPLGAALLRDVVRNALALLDQEANTADVDF